MTRTPMQSDLDTARGERKVAMDVRAACAANFAAHQGDCSGFVKAVATQIGVPLQDPCTAIGAPQKRGLDILVLSLGHVFQIVDGYDDRARVRVHSRRQPNKVHRLSALGPTSS